MIGTLFYQTLWNLLPSTYSWAEERFYSRGGQGPVITQSMPVQNIHHRPWMAPIEVFRGTACGAPPAPHFLGLWICLRIDWMITSQEMKSIIRLQVQVQVVQLYKTSTSKRLQTMANLWTMTEPMFHLPLIGYDLSKTKKCSKRRYDAIPKIPYEDRQNFRFIGPSLG